LRFSVAIDGPAGAGKSTIARILANKLGLMYINTGAMYRALTLKALEKNLSPSDIEKICNELDNIQMYFKEEKLFLNGIDVSDVITMPQISSTVAGYAAISEVRQKLVKMQREMAQEFNVIMDGRDIGTVVLKDAAFKFFLTASAAERAKRRYDELEAKGYIVNYDSILKDIIKRDYDDMHREIDPLVRAEDAIEIDTTGLTIEQVSDNLYNYITKKLTIKNVIYK
jgi:cytidylate kinase